MSKTPAQKRRRDFHTREDWALWAIQVIKSQPSQSLVLDTYSWRTSTLDLLKGIRYARALGALIFEHGHPSARIFRVLVIPASLTPPSPLPKEPRP